MKSSFLILLLLLTQSVLSRQLIDWISSIDNQTATHPRSKVTEFLDILRMIQHQMNNRTFPVCLPGFYSYAGSCYFLSPIKSTWNSASNSCALKRNASLVTFHTNEELNFVVDKLLKPWRINQAFIGLYAREKGQWSWLDGRTFWDSIFGPLFYVYRPETSRCGLINLVNRSQTAIEGRDCSTDEAHFLCKYVQNHCYTKNVCGRGGECINSGLTFRCRCNFLYRGRKCEKLSSKAVQSFIALIIIVLMGLAAFCLKYDLYTYCSWKSCALGQLCREHGQWRKKPLKQPLMET